jgi:hypothetical protein
MSILTDEELINYLSSVDVSETTLTGRVLMQLGLITDIIFKEAITALARNTITINQLAELHSIDDVNVSFLLTSINININGFSEHTKDSLAEFHVYAATSMNLSNSILVYPNIKNSATYNKSGIFFESFYNIKQTYLTVLQNGGFGNLIQAKLDYTSSLSNLIINPNLSSIVARINTEILKLEQDPYFIYRPSFNFDNIFGVDSYIGFIQRGLYHSNLCSPGLLRKFLLEMFDESSITNAPSVDSFIARNGTFQFSLFGQSNNLPYLKNTIILKTVLNPFYTRFNIPSNIRIQIDEDLNTHSLLVLHFNKTRVLLDAYKLLSEKIAYGQLSW